MSIYLDLTEDVFTLLRSNLPSYLTYHSVEHTEHVIAMSEYFCRQENVDGHDLFLVKTAALFHDIGFIRQAHNHEEIGCTMATEMLDKAKLSSSDIKTICGMIMATKIPQHPKTHLEKIIADADLEYLGTDEFYPIGQLLFKEFRHYDPHLTEKRFNEIQVNFMRRHHYHTEYCKTHREAKKQKHIEELLSTM